jgi:hypothetical protein
MVAASKRAWTVVLQSRRVKPRLPSDRMLLLLEQIDDAMAARTAKAGIRAA